MSRGVTLCFAPQVRPPYVWRLRRLPLAPYTLEGVSLGGQETALAIPEWDICFDVGRSPPFAVARGTVLVTHGHMDHAGGLAYHCALRSLLGLTPPTYVVPRENFDAFTDLFDVWRRLDRSPLPCTLVPLSPGETFPLGRDRHALAFRSPHRVPCQGYALVRARTRLLPEHDGKPEGVIRTLKLAGVPITERSEIVEIAFCGDTTIDVVDREAVVRQARHLLLEVTFLDDRVPVAKARSSGHVHLDEVVERADLFENEQIVFTHFSQRYTHGEIHGIVRARLPVGLADRVVVLCPEPERG